MQVAMRVQAAVFTAYALRFDRLSVTHLMRTAWYLAGNRMGSARQRRAFTISPPGSRGV